MNFNFIDSYLDKYQENETNFEDKLMMKQEKYKNLDINC